MAERHSIGQWVAIAVTLIIAGLGLAKSTGVLENKTHNNDTNLSRVEVEVDYLQENYANLNNSYAAQNIEVCNLKEEIKELEKKVGEHDIKVSSIDDMKDDIRYLKEQMITMMVTLGRIEEKIDNNEEK